MKFIWQVLGGCRLLLLVQLIVVASGCPEFGVLSAPDRLQKLLDQEECVSHFGHYQRMSRLCQRATCNLGPQTGERCVPLGTNEQ